MGNVKSEIYSMASIDPCSLTTDNRSTEAQC